MVRLIAWRFYSCALSIVLVSALLKRALSQGAPGGGGGGGGDGDIFELIFVVFYLFIDYPIPTLICLLLVCIGLCVNHMCDKCRESRRVSFRGSVELPSRGATNELELMSPEPCDLPSGIWRGYYDQFGSRHTLADFELQFEADAGVVTGVGVDTIGKYSIDGKCCGNGARLVFKKRYERESITTSGMTNPLMNKGHTVCYSGARVGPNLAQGIKGRWEISSSSSGYTGSGAFHLWPAMPGWWDKGLDKVIPPGQDVDNMEKGRAHVPQRAVYKVTQDNVCVVCFDRQINVCLVPCGHVAVCSQCARQLSKHSCPICRIAIDSVMDFDGGSISEDAVQEPN